MRREAMAKTTYGRRREHYSANCLSLRGVRAYSLERFLHSRYGMPFMNDDMRVRQQRSVFLSAVLTIVFGSAAFVVSFLLCGGLSVYMLAVIGGLVVLGYLHYLLWGHSLSREVSSEIETETQEGELKDEGWQWEEPFRHGRL